MSINIIKNSNFTAYRNCRERAEKIKYIVIHYTGSEGTAQNNVTYFNGGNRNASAHYFVGRDGVICEYCDPEKWYAWHCGGALESSHHPYYGKCTNANSIGIEICTHNNGSNWEFTEKAVNTAIELTKYLMQKFGVSADNVIRHYDVTGKSCPRVPGWGAVGGSAEWDKFKKAIGSGEATTATTTSSTEKKFYRVRKTWADSASQIGAYLILDNAIAEANNAGAKYAVFDWEGKEIYRYSEGSGSKVKEMRFFYPGYTRKESPYDSHGAGVVWYDQNKNAILVDAYTKGSGACNKLISFLLDNGLYSVSAVGTHAHGDHLGGIFQILETPKLTLEHLYVYDPASLKLAGDGTRNGRSAAGDTAYLQKLIDKAKAKGTKIHYVKTGDIVTCGEIQFEVNRHQPSKWSAEYDTGEAWAYLNDGSICMYNRQAQVLLVGDASGMDAVDDCGDIDVVEAGHHCNNGNRTSARTFVKKGVKLAIGCNNEKGGPGNCEFTRYGAGRMIEEGIEVWQLDADIKGVIKGGKMTVSQGTKTRTFDVPFGKIFYRVRKSWGDTASQIGAYTVLANAKECVDKNPGYKVFDETGKQVYPATTSATTATTPAASADPQTDQEKFIAKIGPMAKVDMAKNGILACITIAQAILESGWGKSELAVNANNLFGMKKSLSGNTWRGSSWDGKSVYSKQTKEVYASGPATVQADFRAYGSWEASVNDHSAYLIGAKNGSAYRYKGLVGCTDYRKAAQIIKSGGYATAPDYVDKLCKLIEQYGLTKYNTTYKPSAATSGMTAAATATDGLFRVRKSWADPKSQKGAYRNPRNGIMKADECGNGYDLFDDHGVPVYPDSYSGWFRVRKTWEDAKSQISAHKYLVNALDMADKHPGYSVFDSYGRKIYPV